MGRRREMLTTSASRSSLVFKRSVSWTVRWRNKNSTRRESLRGGDWRCRSSSRFCQEKGGLIRRRGSCVADESQVNTAPTLLVKSVRPSMNRALLIDQLRESDVRVAWVWEHHTKSSKS